MSDLLAGLASLWNDHTVRVMTTILSTLFLVTAGTSQLCTKTPNKENHMWLPGRNTHTCVTARAFARCKGKRKQRLRVDRRCVQLAGNPELSEFFARLRLRACWFGATGTCARTSSGLWATARSGCR